MNILKIDLFFVIECAPIPIALTVDSFGSTMQALQKIPKFHLISCCRNFVERYS